MQHRKKILFWSWVILVAGVLVWWILSPEFFASENIQRLFTSNTLAALVIYFILISVVRCMFLLPLTMFLVPWILVFDPRVLYVVTMIGVAIASTIVYHWSKYLWFDTYFKHKYPKQIARIKHALSKKELPFIILRSFLPFTPTDVICYVCEILKIKLWKCLVGVLIGEWVVVAIYIFGFSEILDRLW